MSDLYKADASKFTRDIIELINHQNNLHLEGQAIMVIAKDEITKLKKEIQSLKQEISKRDEMIKGDKVLKSPLSESL